MFTDASTQTAPNTNPELPQLMVDANATARGLLMRLAGARGDLTQEEIKKWQSAKTLGDALRIASEMRPDLPTLKTILKDYDASTSETKDQHFTTVILRLHSQAGFYTDRAIGDMYYTAHAHSYGGTGSTDSPETLPGTGRPTLHFVDDYESILTDSNPNAGMDGKRVLYSGSTASITGKANEVLEYIFVLEEIHDLKVTVWDGQGSVDAKILKNNVEIQPEKKGVMPLTFKNLQTGTYTLRLTGTTDYQHVLVNVSFSKNPNSGG